jgi:hypothetical protein
MRGINPVKQFLLHEPPRSYYIRGLAILFTKRCYVFPLILGVNIDYFLKQH